MRPSAILDANREAVREAVRRYRTTNPRVFGSVLHGTDREDCRSIHRTKAFQPVLARLSGRFGPSVSPLYFFGVATTKLAAGAGFGVATPVAWCVTL